MTKRLLLVLVASLPLCSAISAETLPCRLSPSLAKVLPPSQIVVSWQGPFRWPLHPGDTQQLCVLEQTDTKVPRPLKGSDVTWFSPYPDIATVDSNGLVTAIGPGKTVVVVKCKTCAWPWSAFHELYVEQKLFP
jgi:hypothetical protein